MPRGAKIAYCLVLLGMMCIPLVVVFGVSLNERKVLLFPPHATSLVWYQKLFVDPNWYGPFATSLLIAFLSAVMALSAALPVAYLLWRYRLFYAKVLYALGHLPFAFPPVIAGMGMQLLWADMHRIGNLENIVLGHTIFLLALPLSIISLGLESIEDEIMEAATTMGADAWRAFTSVVFPMIVPYLISGFAFVFVLSMNEFVISYLLGQSRVVTFPVQIFSSLRGGYSPTLASASVVFILISFAVFGLLGRFADLPKIMGAYRRRS